MDPFEDIIDSRDVVDAARDIRAEGEDADLDATELAILALDDEGRDLWGEEWSYGVALVRDSYFRDYAQELSDDLGLTPDGVGWPLYCIDWDRAVRDLRMDYSAIDFDGVTYWGRA